MARGDDLYARLEVPFMKSFKMLSLPVGARWLYLWLWCHALEGRRETIKRPDNRLLASLSGLSRHPVESYLNRLQVLELLSYDYGTIVVHGIKEKHKQYQWKDALFRDNSGTIQCILFPYYITLNNITLNKIKKKSPARSGKPKQAIEYDVEIKNYFSSISQEQITEWEGVYPAVEISQELGRAREWLLSNPKKRKKNFRRFITNWLGSAQEKGGSIPSTKPQFKGREYQGID